jgi:cysteinyl-tRNA synthetase
LIYPHHEAELAQGESLTGIRPLVRYWVHTGLVNLSGRKMSKSAGNMLLVRELLREYDANELRYYLLSWRYRDDVEFSIPRLKSASKAYAQAVAKAGKLNALAGRTTRKDGPPAKEVRRLLSTFYSAMDDDLDTPRAIEWVEDELIGRSPSDVALGYSALRIVSDVLGVDFLAKS